MAEKTGTFRFSAQPRRGPAGLAMAPLVDIVLLLVCFYLLTTQLVRGRSDPAVELPVMAAAAGATRHPAELVVNLRADGRVTVGGRAMAVEDLAGMLGAELARAIRERKRFRVVVRADRRQPFGGLDEVLGACEAAGLPGVVFRIGRGQGGAP